MRTSPVLLAGLLVIGAALTALCGAEAPPAVTGKPDLTPMDETRARDWLARWQAGITHDASNRYCDKELGEEIGWLITPFLDGFYYGYRATHDTAWIEREIDWADALIKRAVKEPDGQLGWPKLGATGTELTKDLTTDSQLGEAMAFRPLVLLAGEIRATPALKTAYGQKAEDYIRLAEQLFGKWEARGSWRTVKDGGLWVVPPFGLDPKSGGWSAAYERRTVEGFSLPDNKQNLVACWALALSDVTGKPLYKQRAEAWFRVMKARMSTREDGKYLVWNYWDQGGPWDLKADGSLKHWVGVHPNGGYYGVDVEGIVLAYEHGLAFTKADLLKLIATNRDFMWNQQLTGAAFQRIDGGKPDPHWAKTPGVLWNALVPYDATLRKVFEANHDPASWGGTSETPRYLALYAPFLRAGK
jgi:hypothetical protein